MIFGSFSGFVSVNRVAGSGRVRVGFVSCLIFTSTATATNIGKERTKFKHFMSIYDKHNKGEPERIQIINLENRLRTVGTGRRSITPTKKLNIKI